MLSVISLLFWLILIPFCIGLVPVNYISPKKRNPGLVFLAGYFLMWALFEVVCIPVVLWVDYHNFSVASCIFTGAAVALAAAGVFMLYRNWRKGGESLLWRNEKKSEYEEVLLRRQKGRRKAGIIPWQKLNGWDIRAEWLLFLGLVAFQLYKAAAFTSFDGDDAYYVVQSLIAQQADVMYKILPYTGGSTGLDVRHILAVFPMWIAFVAARSGIHATIVSHLIMPFVLIPLTYLVYYEIGNTLFAEDKEGLPVFMIVMSFFQIFGNVSIYTNETFFLTRTWQGKAVTGSLVIPAVLWLLLWIAKSNNSGRFGAVRVLEERVYGTREKETDTGIWILFVCVNMTAGVCSSIAVFLISILLALAALVLAFAERDVRVLLRLGAVCIPNIIYMGIYVVMGYSYLLQ